MGWDEGRAWWSLDYSLDVSKFWGIPTFPTIEHIQHWMLQTGFLLDDFNIYPIPAIMGDYVYFYELLSTWNMQDMRLWTRKLFEEMDVDHKTLQ